MNVLFDKYGFVSPDGNTTDNGIRFTSEWLFALSRRGELTTEIKVKYWNLFNKCEMEPGLLIRDPYNVTEQEGPDNVFAGLAADVLLDTGYAERFISYGNDTKITGVDNQSEWGKRNLLVSYLVFFVLKALGKCKYVYNTVYPGKFNLSAWLGRQPPLIAHAKQVVRKDFTFFQQLMWCLGLWLSARDASSEDGKVLAWFTIMASKGRQTLLMRLASRHWSKKLKEQWPGGIGAVLLKYYNDPEHAVGNMLLEEYGQ